MSETLHEEELLTTGEIAKACGVTVRTVQYYDERGLLRPTERTDGGRRLYDENARKRLETICLLKSWGLPLKAIRGVLSEESGPDALRCLLEEQEKALGFQLAADQSTLAAVRAELAKLEADGRAAGARKTDDAALETAAEAREPDPSNPLSTETDSGVELEMTRFFADKGTRLYRTQRKMIIEGIVVDIVEWGCIVGGFITGNWWPLIAAIPLTAVIITESVSMYHRDARYVCPHCGATFQPGMREFFFANHTPKTRKLVCTACGTKGWCAEVAAPVE